MNSKKILWVNPSFLDYRIPLYTKLNEISNGKFHLLYSKSRIPLRCNNKIIETLKRNAHAILHEKQFVIGSNESDFANASLVFPLPKGLYKSIKKIHPDIIISEGYFQFTPWSLIYSLIYKKPLIIAYERTAYTERNCPFYRRWYRKLLNHFITAFIVNGTLTKRYLISQGVKENKIFEGAMCADSQELSVKCKAILPSQKDVLKSTLFKEIPKGLIFIFVGQLIERKGVVYLLQAWIKHIKHHKEDKLLIVGIGPLFDEFTNEFKLEESIVFTGSVDYSQIHLYYTIADVFVIPTLEDNWSLVVPEAMACGLPIACSIYNGCYPELVKQDRNGTLFDPLKKETIINALSYFHDVDLDKFGNESILIEKDFNPENTAKNIFKAIDYVNSK